MNIKKENKVHVKRLATWLGEFVKRGTSSKELALTITIGFLLGIIPFLGINTILCTFIALRWKLNLPLIIAVNYFVFPLQIILFIPFLKVTTWIFNVSYLLPSYNEILVKIKKDWLTVVTDFGYLNLLAVLVWFGLSIIVGWFLYKGVFYILMKKMKAKHT
jgi:uncharacterized protein (DUF2062 family)